MKKTLSTKNLCITGVITAVLCVLAPISFYIGPIPITLGVFGILLVGGILPVPLSVFSAIAYIILGGVGLPIFAGFKGGFQTLVGPTGGFLMAYPLMVLVIGLTVKIFKRKSFFSLAVGMVVALLVCYGFGTVWFMVSMGKNLYVSLSACVIPFIPIDIAKLCVACAFSVVLNKALRRANVGIA